MQSDRPLSQDAVPTPLANSYWVDPGHLLAGEYPGALTQAEAIYRIDRLLRAGVSSFIDLTEHGELPEYAGLLSAAAERGIRYHRRPIIDHGLPDSRALMSDILDTLEHELKSGRCVYVHCRAGIGRTGTVVGCHLVRRGLSGEEALDRLQILWRQSARSRSWPTVPETDEQINFVRRWNESPGATFAGEAQAAARIEGALVGLALGDAFGGADEPHRKSNGMLATGADMAMTLCVLESLLGRGFHDAENQMQRYLQWSRGAGLTAGVVPAELKRAIASWQWSRKPNAGSHDPKNLDPHSLARTLAVALFMREAPDAAIDVAAEVSRTTQQAPIVLDACRFWAALLVDALSGLTKPQLLSGQGRALQLLRRRTLKPQVAALLAGSWNADASGAETAITVSAAALAAFAAARTFRDGMLSAASAALPATTCALYGALAGAHFGAQTLPIEWRRRLAEDAALRELARRVAN